MSMSTKDETVDTLDDVIIKSWCMNETFHWRAQKLNSAIVREELRRRHESHPMQFLYHIRDGKVSMADKAPATPDKVPTWRPPLYLKFLNDVVRDYCPDINTDILIHVGDGGVAHEAVPIFAFQKPTGANAILLPDIDFLEMGFYETQGDFHDVLKTDTKSCSAVFVGSTTGEKLTKAMVVERKLPRLKSALYFKDHPLVDFRLPVITQSTPEDARTSLLELGFGQGDRLTYREQFQHKFIISLDGFGATCSRLPIVLRSNSILLKYDSPHLLYYFSGLLPWVHYIPISSDNDVNSVLQMERDCPGLFDNIALHGKQFAETFLVRVQAMKYTAALLRAYAEGFVEHKRRSGQISGCPQPSPDDKATDRGGSSDMGPAISILAHLSFRGDVTFDAGEWAGAERPDAYIEGFVLQLDDDTPGEIEYQGIMADGSSTSTCRGGVFCGSRGKRMPLTGIAIRTVGDLANQFECEYRARFANGSQVGPMRQGARCHSTAGTPLRSFHVLLVPRAAPTPLEPAIPTLAEDPAAQQDSARSLSELLMRFESLGGSGHGCEFGLVQRHFGAEPLSLLRWADLSFECLADALEHWFEGVGEGQNTEIFVDDDGDYWSRDKRFHMAMRTFVNVGEISQDGIAVRVNTRLKFLRHKLISDLTKSEKIFVYRNMFRNLSEVELSRLHVAVKAYGSNTLLYLRYADKENLPGTVKWDRPGLMVGYLERFAFSPQNTLIGPSEYLFLEVCKAAAAMAM